jgi:hypothetical protein
MAAFQTTLEMGFWLSSSSSVRHAATLPDFTIGANGSFSFPGVV